MWFGRNHRPGAENRKNRLLGHSVGAFVMSGKYDLQFDTSVNYQGEFWSAGVSGGWSTTLGRKKWGLLELSLGIGYLHSDWRHYYPTDSYDKLIRDKSRTGNVGYTGPTKAKVSLVIPINVNCRKKEASHD